MVIISFILGTWSFSKNDWGEQKQGYYSDMEEVLTLAYEMGVTQIDTAPIYGLRQVEKDIGSIAVSQNFSVSSKFGLNWSKPYSHKNISVNFDAASIIAECECSLERLNRDQLHTYFLHYPPHGGLTEQNIEELHKGISSLKQSGKVAYFGLSNCTDTEVTQIGAVLDVAAVQFEFNALKQWALKKLADTIALDHVQKWTYSPLARGILSGKFSGDEQFGSGDHRNHVKWFNGDEFMRISEVVSGIGVMANNLGLSQAQLFINWIRAVHPDFNILLGVKNAAQLQENTVQKALSSDDISAINSLF